MRLERASGTGTGTGTDLPFKGLFIEAAALLEFAATKAAAVAVSDITRQGLIYKESSLL